MRKQFCLLAFVFLALCLQISAQNKNFTAVSHTLDDKSQVETTYVPPIQHWLSLRGNAELSFSGIQEGLVVNYFAVLAKDSLLYLHISKFGIEMARALCTPDSLIVLLHTSQSYWKGTYSLLGGVLGIPLHFNMLQGLLLLLPDSSWSSVDSSGFLKQSTCKVNTGVNPLFTVHYAQYKNVGNDTLSIYYPQHINFSVPEAEVDVRMNHHAVKVEVPGPSSLRIPKNYTRTKLFIK